MTKRQRLTAWGVGLLGLVLGVAVTVREETPAGKTTRITPDRDSLSAYATCMQWDAKTVKRIAGITHYLRHDPPSDTLAATNGSHVWVSAHIPLYPALRHEWTHLALWPDADPSHRSFHWFRATQCGAITHLSGLTR